MTDHIFNMFLPLLKSQKYISNAEKYLDQEIDINLDKFRDLPLSLQFDSLRYYFHVVGVEPNVQEPYLNVEPNMNITDVDYNRK